MAEDKDNELDPERLKMYAKGFNHGYWLEQGAPEELEKLTKGKDPKTAPVYTQGLIAGSKEYRKEKFLEKLRDENKDLEKDKELDLEL